MPWTEALLVKYEDIFDECVQCSPPDGWRILVESLIEYIHWHNTVHDTDVKVVSISEAHGGLKFVILNQPRQPIIAEEIFGAIHLAETMSCKMCQVCAAPAEFRKYRDSNNKLILQALCDSHFEEKMNEINMAETEDSSR